MVNRSPVLFNQFNVILEQILSDRNMYNKWAVFHKRKTMFRIFGRLCLIIRTSQHLQEVFRLLELHAW